MRAALAESAELALATLELCAGSAARAVRELSAGTFGGTRALA